MTREITTHWRVTPEAHAVSGAVCRLLEQAEHDRQQERVEELRAGQDRNQGRTVEDEADGEFRHAQQANNGAEPRSEKADGADEIGEGEQERVRADSFDLQSVNGYDSAEQRQARAECYARSGDQRATQARILADEGNAWSPVYATRSLPSRRRRPSRGPHQPHPRYRIVSDRER